MTKTALAAGVENDFHLHRVKIVFALRMKLILIMISLAAVGLRLWGLDAALWYDEAFSAWLAQLPPERILEATLGDVHPPAYYLLLWAVNDLLGHSEAVLRLPSVLAGLALVYLVAKIGLALGLGQKAVWLATCITAFSPFQIYYSQEARVYSLLSLAVAGAALGLIERRGWLATTGALAALYLHHLAGVFLVGLWLAAFVTELPDHSCDRPGRSRFLAWTGLAVAIGFLPGLGWLLLQLRSVGGGYWIPVISSPGRLLATVDDLLWFYPHNPFVFATAVITALGLAWIGWGRGRLDRFLLTAALAPLLLITTISLVWQPILISRVMAPMAPFYYLLLGRSVTLTRRRLVLWLVLALPTAGLILAGPLVGIGRDPVQRDLIELYGQYRPGDAMYHANVGSYVVWRYYRPDIPQFLWPQQTSLSQTLTRKTRLAMGMKEMDFDFIHCITLVEEPETRTVTRWWLIYFHNPVTQPAEIAYVEHLVNDYPSKKIKRLRVDSTVEAWLVLIEPDCSASAGRY